MTQEASIEEARWLSGLPDAEREPTLAWIAETQVEGVVLRDGDGRVIEANRAACALLGTTRDELLGAGDGSAIWERLTTLDGAPLQPRSEPPADAGAEATTLDELLVRVAVDDGEPRTIRVRSQARWVDGRRTATLTTFVDVTRESHARRRAQEGLRMIERITESNSAFLFTVRVRDDRRVEMLYISPGIERLLGRPLRAGETPEGAWYAAIHPEDITQARDAIRTIARGGGVSVEYRVRRHDGEVRWIQGRGLRRDEPDGIYLDSFVTDVTTEHRLQREHEAIGRIATAIATGRELEDVFAAAAQETARVMEAGAGGVVALGDELPELCGSWHAPDGTAPLQRAVGALVLDAAGRPTIGVDALETGVAAAAAPVPLEGETWGALLAVREGPPFDAEERGALERLGDLVGTAVRVARARESLLRRATTDPVTDLVNHRAFHEQLRAEVGRARRYGRRASLVLLDLDEFKGVNDREGHQAGDELIRAVARTLAGLVRETEVVARLGGDEFAVLLPETGAAGAAATAERMRRAIERLPTARAHGVTASAGVADLEQADSAGDLVRLADGALYWSKLRGRNLVTIYDPDHVRELSAQERADHLAQSHVLGAVRVLARLIDLKDASTSRHSERVADLAVLLAGELGWSAERCSLLRDAALVHDVGKVIIPSTLLAKPRELTPDEFALMKEHAAIGAEIASEALGTDQVRWIREHHERPDGTGYPDGLLGEAISAGARILAFADGWDVMISERPYKPAKTVEAALAECRSLAGTQFDLDVLAAFEALWERKLIVGP